MTHTVAETLTKTFTKEDIAKMSADEVADLISRPGASFTGTAVVRRADGSIKYDDENQKGQFGE